MSRLPEGWSEPAFIEDFIVADGLELGRAGVSSVGPDGQELTGSAAAPGEVPRARSYYELLERVTVIEAARNVAAGYALRDSEERLIAEAPREAVFPESDAPDRWRFARSNGVALHGSWKAACLRAYWELVERDRVLRAWYGDTKACARPLGESVRSLTKAASYDWRAFEFPAQEDTAFGREVAVAGVFGFPSKAGVPLVMGFGARPTFVDALEAAATEATQLLAFLWGEAIPDETPAPGPTAMHHLENNLHPDRAPVLRAWLEEGHRRYERSGRPAKPSGPVVFVDLTPAWLQGGLRVAKAVHDDAEPLAFGESPFGAHLPQELRAHPIA